MPIPGQGAGGELGGGVGAPLESGKRDRPRPLLPAGKAIKHLAAARSPTLESRSLPRTRRQQQQIPGQERHHDRTRDAGDHAIVAVSDDACPVPSDLSWDAGRSISIQTGQSWRGCACRGYGQILAID
uniref:Uncharacterized protein n=1 Tax=Sphaerodactylus townsendi TaxID=933632 RepID=A0ACB8FUI0_9SAUR